MVRAWFAVALWRRVVLGLLLGTLVGIVWPSVPPTFTFVGEIFLRLIRMLVVPIAFVTIAAGVATLGDPKRLGSVGGRTVGLFMATTLIAISLGMAIGLLLEPGVGARIDPATAQSLGEAPPVSAQLIGIIPLNIFKALAEGDMLAVIFFAGMVGIGTMLAGESGQPVVVLLQSFTTVLFHIVRIVMEVTPFGVFSLISVSVAANGLAVFGTIGWLAACVVIGAVVQMAVVHGLILTLLARVPLRRFFMSSIDALIVAFSTASSSATLPIGLRVATERLGIGRAVASTVMPVGASIGKDGSAMYIGLLSMFGLQAFGIHPDAAMLGMILLTGLLGAFATAPIPSASLFMLAAVLAGAGVSADRTALVVGLILPFDRVLDMIRTVPSASANLVVATTVARWEGDLDDAGSR